jgi:hypothetical protein
MLDFIASMSVIFERLLKIAATELLRDFARDSLAEERTHLKTLQILAAPLIPEVGTGPRSDGVEVIAEIAILHGSKIGSGRRRVRRFPLRLVRAPRLYQPLGDGCLIFRQDLWRCLARGAHRFIPRGEFPWFPR